MQETALDIRIPDLCLVVLVGRTGSGRAAFAQKHFEEKEVLHEDAVAALVTGGEHGEAAEAAAAEALQELTERRLRFGKRTVVIGRHSRAESRARLLAMARAHDVAAFAILLDVPTELCLARRPELADRILREDLELRRGRDRVGREGFREVWHLDQATAAQAQISNEPMPADARDRRGPFDVIGDVHGCASELEALLSELGWREEEGVYHHPESRTAVFVGDLVDRGPEIARALEIVMRMVRAGTALCVEGNHEAKLSRLLAGKGVRRNHGLAESEEQLAARSDAFRAEVARFLRERPSHYVLDGGALVVAHAGLPEHLHGRSSKRVRAFCLYGETTGETDDLGLPVRLDWARSYRGRAAVVYGHTPVARARWHNETLCIDTGCVFGGSLTALRWPERQLVEVPAQAVHYASSGALVTPPVDYPAPRPLEAAGDYALATRFGPPVTIRSAGARAARDALSSRDAREAPVYLPPLIPRPPPGPPGRPSTPLRDALAYYLEHGVTDIVCETSTGGEDAVLFVRRAEAKEGDASGDASLSALFSATGRALPTPPTRATANDYREALTPLFEANHAEWLLLQVSVGTSEVAHVEPKASLRLHALLARSGAVSALDDRAAQLRQMAALVDGHPLEVGAWHPTDLTRSDAIDDAIAWWDSQREAGCDALVVRPRWLHRGRGPVTFVPALLGSELAAPVVEDAPVQHRRSLRRGRGALRVALRQHALGLEGLARLVEEAPRERVRECVLGVLALTAPPRSRQPAEE